MSTRLLHLYPFPFQIFVYNSLVLIHFAPPSTIPLVTYLPDLINQQPLHYLFAMLDGIHHPSFRRVTPTKYVMYLGSQGEGDNYRISSVHVGQLVDFLIFDEALRKGRKIQNNSEVPLGYHEFADIFNLGAHRKDKRRITTIQTMQSGPPRITLSNNPVTAHHFRITPTQCGAPSSNPFGMTDEQAALVVGQFASSMAEEKVRKTNFAQERIEKRRAATSTAFEDTHDPEPSRKRKRDNFKKPRYFEDVPSSEVEDTGLKIFDSRSESFFLDSPHASTSGLTSMAAIQPIEHVADDQMSAADATELHPTTESETQEPFDFTTGPLPFGITESDLRDLPDIPM